MEIGLRSDIMFVGGQNVPGAVETQIEQDLYKGNTKRRTMPGQ
jgi:hypothetical protein